MKNKAILPILLALALLGACKSSTTVEENEIGIIRGSVQIDENCQPLPNRSGATVSVEGTAFSTITDTAGNWMISNVPAGIYNILITKPGFDTDLISQDQFSGAGTQFLENQAISSESPLPDSVLISSIQISKIDSVQQRFKDDTILVNGHDSIYNVRYMDTAGYEYFLTITFTMQGPDSAISFDARLTDSTRPAANEFGGNDGFIAMPQGISRNGSYVGHVTWITATGFNGQGSPQPGDTIVVTTTPSSPCNGRKVITLSKSFVLP